MATLADSIAIVQSVLDDVPADVETNTRLIPIGKSAYRRLQRKLASNGVKLMRTEASLALAAAATSITAASSPPLPTGFLWPRAMEEYATGDLATTRTPMEQVDQLPARDQADKLAVWVWEAGVISFVGSPIAVTVVLEYERELSALTDQTSALLILGCEDALGYRMAAAMARARGQEDLWRTLSGEAMELEAELINNMVRVDHGISRRRLGYNDW